MIDTGKVFEDGAYTLMRAELDRALSAISGADLSESAARQVLNQDLPVWRHLLAASPFVAAYLARYPQKLSDFVASRLDPFDPGKLRSRLSDAFKYIVEEAEFDRQLRRLRNEQMVLIAIRDLQGLVPLEETLRHLSALADALVEVCLHWPYKKLEKRHGCPQTNDGRHMSPVVLAMGKLGAEELNFSSDIDLILAYEEDGVTNGEVPIEHHEFFTRLARRFRQSLNKTTEDGFVFRVDLRLRPYGNSGPLLMSFAAIEEYYQTQGREWERYAMIKARAIGMDTGAGERLLDSLQPFVYRRYLDFGVIQSLRDLKVMIDKDTIRKNRQDNLKLGPGGIREIEFIAQVFQLMRGGRDTGLRSRSIPLVLARLAERELITTGESNALIAAWRFLRYAENRIQSMYDRQEHELPKSTVDRQRLALSMGYGDWSDFIRALSRHRRIVQQCFDNVFAESKEKTERQPSRMFWLSISDDNIDSGYLMSLGYRHPKNTTRRIQDLKMKGVYRRLSGRGQALMDKLMPTIIDLAVALDNPDQTLTRLLSVIAAIAQRESYLALLVEAPPAREQLVKLCGASSWITTVVTHHPLLLDELVDPRRLYAPPGREKINAELARMLIDRNPDDVEGQMESLRAFKQAQQLRVAVADTMQTMPLMRVSDHLTWIAESLMSATLELAWKYLVSRHGYPMYELNGIRTRAQFAVIGLGKLGGIELGYGSDLDLIFVHDSQGQAQVTDGGKPIDNSRFFTRLAQRLVHLSSTLTSSGVLYKIDMRLRPNGKSGMLVTSLAAFAAYQREEAWVWEHQALIRARPVAGDSSICDAFRKIRHDILSLAREPKKLAGEVMEMRQRMYAELDTSNKHRFDLKHGVGGIVDIEFMVQYVILGEAHCHPQLLRYTDNIRLTEVAGQVGALTAEQGKILIDAYRGYRACLHRRVLQGLDHCVAQADFEPQRARVMRVWQQLFKTGAEERAK